MPDYNNSKIYKIISPSNPDLVYYGSTTQPLSKRLADHMSLYKKGTSNTTSKQILCFDDAIILLVENISCNSKEELHKKEGEYILNNICINKRIAGMPRNETNKRYRENNKETIKENNKQYRELNKEKINELARKKYYENKNN